MLNFLGMVFAFWANRHRYVRVLTPAVLVATVVTAAVLQPAVIGPSAPSVPPVVTESVALTLAPASDDRRWRAALEGRYGSTVNGAYAAMPVGPDGDDDQAIWWSHNGNNLNPCDHVSALAGYTCHEVALGSGAITAATRATATCAVVDAIDDFSCSVNSATVTITGPIDADTTVVGGAYTARGAAGLFGHHTTAVLTNGNPWNDALGVHGTFDDGPAVLTSVCILLGTPETDDTVRLGVYVGGTSTSFTGTALRLECTTTGSATGYACCSAEDGEAVSIADNASVWVVAKADQDDDTPADGTTTHPAFSSLAALEDWTNRNLVIFTDTGIDDNPSVAYPASLAGLEAESDIATGNGVVMMASIETRVLPLVGNASLGGTTTNGLVLGISCDTGLAASESALTAPDAGGANVLAGMVTPNILGMLMTRSEIGVGGTHTAQFRLAEYTGGLIGNPNGATLLQDHGQTSGSSTNAWVGINASPEVAIPAADEIHMALRGNGNITVRFAADGNEVAANCPDAPSDFATANDDEYETNTGNAAHSTNPATSYETPFVRDAADDLQPANHPLRRVRYRVAGDSVAVVP